MGFMSSYVLSLDSHPEFDGVVVSSNNFNTIIMM